MVGRILENRLKSLPKSVMLLGPRQVGKTSLCRKLCPDLSIQLADEEVYTKYLKDPGLLRRAIEANTAAKLILIDEVQRLPALLNTVQSIIDADSSLKFLLTGSSARKLKKGKANLLPGRVFYESLTPLLYWEIEEQFELDRALRFGQLPEIYLNDYGPELLDSYVTGYLREEIQAEALTKDLAAYARFLDLAAEVSGQYINYSKLASDSEIGKETIRRYFTILEETLLVERIPSYSKVDKKRKARQRDKFLFFDLGVRNSICELRSDTLSKEQFGPLFEQWLLLQCFYFNKVYQKKWKIMTYRDDGGVEIDLLIDTGDKFVAVEIKSNTKVTDKAFKNLTRIDDIFGFKSEKLVVYLGEESQKFNTGLAISYRQFLSEFLPNL